MADSAQPLRQRARRLSLELATAKKRDEIGCLLEAYRGACVRSLWQVPGRLDKRTLARLPAERSRRSRCRKTRDSCFDVSPAITKGMPISSALETS
jgi:hypothetical protein